VNISPSPSDERPPARDSSTRGTPGSDGDISRLIGSGDVTLALVATVGGALGGRTARGAALGGATTLGVALDDRGRGARVLGSGVSTGGATGALAGAGSGFAATVGGDADGCGLSVAGASVTGGSGWVATAVSSA